MAIKQIIPATGVVAYLTDQRRLPVIAWALHDDDDRVTGLVIAWDGASVYNVEAYDNFANYEYEPWFEGESEG